MHQCKAAVFFLLLLGFTVGRSEAQAPTSCFEIESILVDACGNGLQEGLNEEVIFQVGPTALNTADMTVAWPNATNTWTGICQNGTSAAKVAYLNSTITTGCGLLVEPVGGVLPAGKRVILFTSITTDETLHSFTALNDTLYAIFHCGANMSGNFANTGAGTRTLTISFSTPLGCSDVVTYDRALLTGGNGATVNFCWNGAPVYVNYGCTAPYYQLSTNAGTGQTVCEGTPVNLSGSVSSCIHRYEWFGGTGTFSNSTSLTPTYTPGPGETGAVTLYLGQFTSCDTAMSSVTITFTPAPTFSLGSDTSFCGSFSYSIGPGITGQSYSWSTGATTQNITATTPGTYALTLTDATGCQGVDTIIIGTSTLNDLGFMPDDTICPGATYFLFPSVVGSSYNWSTGATTSSINITTPGTYSLTLTTPTNCVGIDTFHLYHHVPTTVSLGNDTTICLGNTVMLDADPSGSYPGATYQWSTGATTQTITVGATGNYAVTLTSTNFCEGIDTILVTVSTSIPLDIGTDTSVCAGTALLLDAGSGLSYQWSTGATTQTISVNTTGTYSVTVTFGVGCQTADTVNVTVNPNPTVHLGNDTLYCPAAGLTLDAGVGGGSYSWSTGATTQTISVSAGGTYTVTVTTAANCSASDTILVTQGIDPQVNLGPDVQLCPGQSLTLDAGTQATTYLWSTGATSQTISVTASGTYWAVVTTSCGTDSSAMILTVLPAPMVDAGPDDTLCAGDTMTLAMAQATNGLYMWTASSGSFDNPTALNPLYQADSFASGTVQLVLTLTDSCGSYADTLVLEVLPRVSLAFTLPDTVCFQTPVQIAYVGNPDSVLWMGAGTFNPPSGSPTVYTPAPNETGLITVSAQAYGACGVQPFPVSYYSEDTVIASFSWTPQEIYPGTHVQFLNGSFPITLPVHWHFGDSFFSIEEDPMHRFYHSGLHLVELIAYGARGCNDTLVIPLNVLPTDTIIPNVFTPNGDGINDVFNFKVPPTESFSLTIFDRWGRVMYSSQNPEEKWDGTTSGGGHAPDGVYFYVFRLKLLAGTVLNYNGPVTLLR